MQQACNRKDLLKALELTIPGVADGELVIEGTDAFLFNEDRVQTYNSTLSITYPFFTGVNGAVKAKELFRILNKMNGDQVVLEVKDDKTLVITSGTTEVKMNIISGVSFNNLAPVVTGDTSWCELPTNFKEIVSFSLGCVSKHPHHGVLNGVYIEDVDVFGCDNYRVAWGILDASMPVMNLPREAVVSLLKLKHVNRYMTDLTWTHFTDPNGVIFSARLLSAVDYPAKQIRKLFTKPTLKTYKFHDDIIPTLDRISVLSYTDVYGHAYISMRKEGSYLICEGEQNCGTVVDKLPITEDEFPSDTTIQISPELVRQMLAHNKEFALCDNALVFRTPNKSHYVTLVG